MPSQMMRCLRAVAVVFALSAADPAMGFLDFIGEKADDAVKSAAYVDAVAELTNELDESSPINQTAQDLKRRTERLRTQVSEVYYASDDFKSLLEGPDWSSESLEQNIRYTSRYIRRAKRLLVQLGLVGTDVATAMNTAETNSALNEMLKNQQTQILLQKEERIDHLEKELRREKEWQKFIVRERQKRRWE